MTIRVSTYNPQRTKLYKSGNGSSGKVASAPRNPFANTRLTTDNIGLAAAYELGKWGAEQFIDRPKDVSFSKLGDELYDKVMSGRGQMNVGANTNAYLTSDDLVKAGVPNPVGTQREAKDGMENTTDANVEGVPNAVGVQVQPQDAMSKAKDLVYETQTNDYAKYGPNPRQAKRDEQKILTQAENMSQTDLTSMPWENVKSYIDNIVDNSKLGYVGGVNGHGKAAMKQYLYDRVKAERENQAETAYNKFLIDSTKMTPEQRDNAAVQYATKYLNNGIDSVGKLFGQIPYQSYLKKLEREQKLQDLRDQNDINLKFYKDKADVDIDTYGRKAEISERYKPATGRRGTANPSGEVTVDEYGNVTTAKGKKVKTQKDVLISDFKQYNAQLKSLQNSKGEYKNASARAQGQQLEKKLAEINFALTNYDQLMGLATTDIEPDNIHGLWNRVVGKAAAAKALHMSPAQRTQYEIGIREQFKDTDFGESLGDSVHDASAYDLNYWKFDTTPLTVDPEDKGEINLEDVDIRKDN